MKHDVHNWLKEHECYLKHGDGCTLTSSWMNEEAPASPSGIDSAFADQNKALARTAIRFA